MSLAGVVLVAFPRGTKSDVLRNVPLDVTAAPVWESWEGAPRYAVVRI